MRTTPSVLCFVLLVAAAAIHAEDAPVQPTLGERGKLLFADDFERAETGSEWASAKGTWTVSEGVLKGVEKAEDQHAAVLKHKITLKDFVAQVSVRFDGGKMAAFSLNGKGGHICRVMITPKSLALKKDKPNKKSEEKGETLGTANIELKAGEWYTLQVEVSGKAFRAQLAGFPPLSGEHAGIDVEKLDLAFPVAGEGVSFDNLKIWELAPKSAAN